jgi:glutamate-1-semialdehyde aminotransferase
MVHPSNIELWFVSTVHTESDIDETLQAFEDSVSATRPILTRADD